MAGRLPSRTSARPKVASGFTPPFMWPRRRLCGVGLAIPRPIVSKIKLIHVPLGTVDPAVPIDDLIVDESDLLVAGQSEVHSVGDFLTVQYHYREFVHRITS